MTTVALIAAVAENGVIGVGGGLPWHLPDDLRHFMRLTTGHLLVMGRRTFASLDGPLKRRRTVVLTRDPEYCPPGVLVAPSLDAALPLARPGEDVFVCGGTEVYRTALPRADRLYLTRVHATVEGDTTFPEVDWSQWELVDDEFHPADARHPLAFSFRTYRRR